MPTIKATYTKGTLILERPLDLPDGTEVSFELSRESGPAKTLRSSRKVEPGTESWRSIVGIMPREDAEAMMQSIEEEFGKIDPEMWE